MHSFHGTSWGIKSPILVLKSTHTKNNGRRKYPFPPAISIQLMGIDAPVPPATIPSDCAGLSDFPKASASEDAAGAEDVV